MAEALAWAWTKVADAAWIQVRSSPGGRVWNYGREAWDTAPETARERKLLVAILAQEPRSPPSRALGVYQAVARGCGHPQKGAGRLSGDRRY